MLLVTISSTALAVVQVHEDPNEMDTITRPIYQLKGQPPVYPEPGVLVADASRFITVEVIDIESPPKEGDLVVGGYAEDENGGMQSEVHCSVDKDTITCGL